MLEPGKVIAVTGASGYIGSWLLQQLEPIPGRGKLVAFDKEPPPWPLHNAAIYLHDVTRSIADLLRHHQVDTVIHLAQTTRAGRARGEIAATRRNNWRSTEQVLESCQQAGVKHLIYLSDSVIYGAAPGNSIPLTEEQAAPDIPNFPYGRDIYQSELTLQSSANAAAPTKAAILRTCLVLGPSAGGPLTAQRFPRRFWGVGRKPPYQFLHEDDLFQIIIEFIRREQPGIFNVAADGVVFLDEIARLTHRKLTQLPPFLAYGAVGLSRNILFQPDAIKAELAAARYPVLMSAAKLKQTLGYRFRHTSLETLTAYANYTAVAETPPPYLLRQNAAAAPGSQRSPSQPA